MEITVGSDCYEHTHFNNYDVFDASPWLTYHPGGWKHIAKFAQDGSVEFLYPASHAAWRFDEHYSVVKNFGYRMGRYGDTVATPAHEPDC